MYIMTLGVLATYRHMGIGTQNLSLSLSLPPLLLLLLTCPSGTVLLEYVLKVCKERPHIKQVYLHVQVNNDTAIEFYKKFGFEVSDTLFSLYLFLSLPPSFSHQQVFEQIFDLFL